MCREASAAQLVVVKRQAATKDEALREEVCGRAMRAMCHPNVARLLDSFIDKGYICHVHELADSTLHHYVHSRHFSYIPYDVASKIAGEIAAGLSFLHNLPGGPVTHGDLSDKNILLYGAGLEPGGGVVHTTTCGTWVRPT